jgi:hypothetical protein
MKHLTMVVNVLDPNSDLVPNALADVQLNNILSLNCMGIELLFPLGK